MQFSDELNQKKFGTVNVASCNFYLNDLLKEDSLTNANIFYEMFIVDGEDRLIDVPVLVKDLRLADDSKPNAGSAMSDSMVFSRRFIVIDTISSVSTVTNKLFKQEGYVRWANSIQIKVELDPSAPE